MSGPYGLPVMAGLNQGKTMRNTQKKYEASRCNGQHDWQPAEGTKNVSCADRDTGEPIKVILRAEQCANEHCHARRYVR